MSELDIMQRVRQSLQDVPDYKNFGLRDADIMLDRLTLVPVDVKWSSIRVDDLVGINNMVKVEKNNTFNAESKPQIRTEKDSDIMGKVVLTDGIVKGLNKMLRLPLDERFQDILGDSVYVHLGRQVTDIIKDKMKIAVSVQVDAHSASATIRTKKTRYTGNFTCEVLMSGRVLIDSNDEILQQPIQEILPELSERNKVRHQVQGNITFVLDNTQNVEIK